MLFLATLVFASLAFGQQAALPPDLAAAHNAEQAHDFATAESIYTQLAPASHDATLYQRLGLVRHLQNKFDSAAQAFREAVKLDPSLWSSHLFLGIDLYRMNQFDAADSHLTTANSLHPNEPEIMFWLGATKLARHEFMAGFKTLEGLLQRDPGNVETLRMLAESYANYGTALLDQVAEKYPDSPAGLVVQGKAFEFEGSYAKALESYRAALALDPHRPGLGESIERAQARLAKDDAGPR